MAKQPMNPLAGAAGPGPYSTRTDNLQFQSDSYGSAKENAAIKGAVPISKSADFKGEAPSTFRRNVERNARLFDESAYPEQDIMAGTDRGPDVGSDALGMNQIKESDNEVLAKYLPAMDAMAAAPDTPESFRIFVRSIQANIFPG
jgi:hypothetical protein